MERESGGIAIATTTTSTDVSRRLEVARQFAIETARLAATTRCTNVVVLDVTDLSPVTDFFVIGTGTSPRQMRTVCDDAIELGESCGYPPMSTAGYEDENWILVDFVDVVLHVFSDNARMFYDLDGLWGDARRVPWKPEGQKSDEQAASE